MIYLVTYKPLVYYYLIIFLETGVHPLKDGLRIV